MHTCPVVCCHSLVVNGARHFRRRVQKINACMQPYNWCMQCKRIPPECNSKTTANTILKRRRATHSSEISFNPPGRWRWGSSPTRPTRPSGLSWQSRHHDFPPPRIASARQRHRQRVRQQQHTTRQKQCVNNAYISATTGVKLAARGADHVVVDGNAQEANVSLR